MKFLYLDHAATSPLRESVWDAMRIAEDLGYGNPAGSHTLSRNAKNIIEESREVIAKSVGAIPSEIIFTSGGTESDNWCLKVPFYNKYPTRQDLVTSSIEHEAVLNSAEWVEGNGFSVEYVRPSNNGKVQVNEFCKKIQDSTSVASLMWGNNETGVIQPIHEIGKKLNSNNDLIFHSDVVQGYVSKKIDFYKANVKSGAISAHKVGGPKGIGAMFLHSEYKLSSFFHGGKQELDRRAGTVNVMGVAGFAAAVREQQHRFDDEVDAMLNERNRLEEILSQDEGTVIIGKDEERLPHISNIQFNGNNSENLLVYLDLEGVGVSRGSACASGAQKPSHVLISMGIDKVSAESHLRISFGWSTKKGDGEKGAKKILEAVKETR